MSDYPIYPHLGMTEDQFATICQELFEGDQVLAKHNERIEEYGSKVEGYEQRAAEHMTEIRRLEGRLDEINAELKVTSRQKAETHGLVAGMKYHIKVANIRVKESKAAIERRKRQLYLNEARRRLGQLGKELKLGSGRRKYAQNLGTAVIDKPNENQTTSE